MFHPIAAGAENDDSDAQSGHVLLVLEVLIGCDQYRNTERLSSE